MKANGFYTRKPDWLKIRLPRGEKSTMVMHSLNGGCLNSICTSGMCPNRGECWSNGTATFMIGGNICTRSCRFCNVATGRPLPLDNDEPRKIAETIARWQLKHAVLTSVDRDDLPDGGAAHWVTVVKAIRDLSPATTLEVLVPDFKGKGNAPLDSIIAVRPEVISHNLETVRRLTPGVRSVATYDSSLEVIRRISESGVRSKSGIMLGLGETSEEVEQALADLRRAGCQVVTIGQYLQPTERHIPVVDYVEPEEFDRLGDLARKMGFRHVESAPLVRSSYHAERHVL